MHALMCYSISSAPQRVIGYLEPSRLYYSLSYSPTPMRSPVKKIMLSGLQSCWS